MWWKTPLSLLPTCIQWEFPNLTWVEDMKHCTDGGGSMCVWERGRHEANYSFAVTRWLILINSNPCYLTITVYNHVLRLHSCYRVFHPVDFMVVLRCQNPIRPVTWYLPLSECCCTPPAGPSATRSRAVVPAQGNGVTVLQNVVLLLDKNHNVLLSFILEVSAKLLRWMRTTFGRQLYTQWSESQKAHQCMI